MFSDHSTRRWLFTYGICWLLLSVANFQVSTQFRWAPDVTGALGLGTGALVLALAIRPHSVTAYRFGGTLAIGTLMFRTASIGVGFFAPHNPDALWILLPSFALTVILGSLYWAWWLNDVKRWHEAHKRTHAGRH